MKWNILLIFGILVLRPYSMQSQFDFGLCGGLSTLDVKAEHLTYVFTDREQLSVETRQARYGLQFGAFALLQHHRFFLMPEVIFHAQEFNHYLKDLNSAGEWLDVIRSEKLNTLDLSLFTGYKRSFLRLGGGVLARMHVDNVSQLWAEKGFDQQIDRFRWGVQAGIGLDIFMIHLDLRYQIDLDKFGDHITFFGEKAYLADRQRLLSLRLGWSF